MISECCRRRFSRGRRPNKGPGAAQDKPPRQRRQQRDRRQHLRRQLQDLPRPEDPGAHVTEHVDPNAMQQPAHSIRLSVCVAGEHLAPASCSAEHEMLQGPLPAARHGFG